MRQATRELRKTRAVIASGRAGCSPAVGCVVESAGRANARDFVVDAECATVGVGWHVERDWPAAADTDRGG